MCENSEDAEYVLKSLDVAAIPKHPEEELNIAHALINPEDDTKTNDDELHIPTKKRKTRRGKRRHPYLKNRSDRRKSGETEKVIKPEAPHNSNQFLIEDHGNPQEIDQRLRSENNAVRNRDSSISQDSDAEGISSEDEDAFLQKDFDDTYENLKVERLNMLSKSELIVEFLQQEKRNESKRRTKPAVDADVVIYKKELARLNTENELLRKENKRLRVKIYGCSDSVDSESDSSTSCTTCTSPGSEPEANTNSPKTNGHLLVNGTT